MFPMSQTIYLHLVKLYSQVGKQTHKKVFISLSKQINYNKNTHQSVFVQQLTVTEQTFYKMPLFYILLLISSHSESLLDLDWGWFLDVTLGLSLEVVFDLLLGFSVFSFLPSFP